MLSAVQVTISTGSTTRLRNASLNLMPGELVAVVGPNGAGKSTLLHALAGKVSLNQGSVQLNNKHLSHWDRKVLAQRRAVLSQHSQVAFDFNVYDVVMFGRGPHVEKTETGPDHAIVQQCIDEMELTRFSDRICNRLSGGEQQRVHIARALVQIIAIESTPEDSNYLLLDEPTSNLDIQHQHLVMHAFRKRARQGAGVLAVLHDLNLAASYADKILVIDGGEIVTFGSPAEVMTPSLLNKVFKVNFIVQTHPQLDRPFLLTIPTSQPNSKPVTEAFTEALA